MDAFQLWGDIGNHSNVCQFRETRVAIMRKTSNYIRKNPFEHSRCSGAYKIHIDLQKQKRQIDRERESEKKIEECKKNRKKTK